MIESYNSEMIEHFHIVDSISINKKGVITRDRVKKESFCEAPVPRNDMRQLYRKAFGPDEIEEVTRLKSAGLEVFHSYKKKTTR